MSRWIRYLRTCHHTAPDASRINSRQPAIARTARFGLPADLRERPRDLPGFPSEQGESVAGGSVWRWALIATEIARGAVAEICLTTVSVAPAVDHEVDRATPWGQTSSFTRPRDDPQHARGRAHSALPAPIRPLPPKPYRTVSLVARRPAGAMAVKPHHATSVAAAGKPIHQADSVIRIVGSASFVRRPRPPPLPSRRP